MRKNHAEDIVAATMSVLAMPVYACGMATSPGISDILCIESPLEILIAFSLLAAVLVGLDSAISKAMRKFRRSSEQG